MASSTPSAQVRIPVGDLVSPPPPPDLCSHYTTWGKTIRDRKRKGAVSVGEAGGGKKYPSAWKLSGGGKNILGGRRWAKKSKKILTVLKIVAQYQNYPIPDPNTLRDILCPKLNAIGYLDTLHKLYPILIYCGPILIHCRIYTPS